MRCNTGVNPKFLLDQHLIAEYRELMIPYGQIISLKTKHPEKDDSFLLNNIPSKFKLGEGHIRFWRNKQLYLVKRHEVIIDEMRKRNFNTNFRLIRDSKLSDKFFGDYFPTREESMIVRERIVSRVKEKPQWYRYYGVRINKIDNWIKLIMDSDVVC